MQLTAVDTSVLAGLCDVSAGDDPALLNEIINLYLIDTPPQIFTLQQASAAGNAALVRATAHALSGNSSGLGATQLPNLARQLEEQARAENLENAAALIAAIVSEFEQVRSELNTYLEQANLNQMG